MKVVFLIVLTIIVSTLMVTAVLAEGDETGISNATPTPVLRRHNLDLIYFPRYSWTFERYSSFVDLFGYLPSDVEAETLFYSGALVPQRGDIIAKTIQGQHILIKPNGMEFQIDSQTFHAHWRNPAVAPDKSFRLVVNGRNVLNHDYHHRRAPGAVAHAEGKKHFIENLVAVDNRGLYGAVVQAHREILLFEAVDAHHQGVAYVIPPDFKLIESISFGADSRKNDLLLVLRRVTGTPAIFWLSPTAVFEDAPPHVHQECYNARWRLHDCLMRYNRKMPKELILVREDAYDAIVVW